MGKEKKGKKNPTTSLEGFQLILVCAWSTQSAEYCGHRSIDLKKIFHQGQVNQIWLLQEDCTGGERYRGTKLVILKMRGNKKCGQSLRPYLSQEIRIGCGENRVHWTLEHTTLKFPKIQEVIFWKWFNFESSCSRSWKGVKSRWWGVKRMVSLSWNYPILLSQWRHAWLTT